jgi:hypothetical protein
MDNTRELLQSHYDQELLFADGFDDAIIGVSDKFGDAVVVYCIDKMINILMEQGEDYFSAREYLEYNTLNAWVGKHTPIYVESVKCFMD